MRVTAVIEKITLNDDQMRKFQDECRGNISVR